MYYLVSRCDFLCDRCTVRVPHTFDEIQRANDMNQIFVFIVPGLKSNKCVCSSVTAYYVGFNGLRLSSSSISEPNSRI